MINLKEIKLIVFDFDGVFTDNKVYLNENGEEFVCCDRRDAEGLKRLKKQGKVEMLVLSTEVNKVVSARCKKLQIECVQECENKADKLVNIIIDKGITTKEVAYVGNDINDIECLKMVGMPIVVLDCVNEAAHYSEIWLHHNGGNLAVREVCDMFYEANNE